MLTGVKLIKRRIFSRPSVGLLGLAACCAALGLRYTKTAPQDGPVPLRGVYILLGDHAGLVVVKNSITRGCDKGYQLKLLLGTPDIVRRTMAMVPLVLSKIGDQSFKLGAPGTTGVFDLRQHFPRAWNCMPSPKLRKVLQFSSVILCPDELENFTRLANGEKLDSNIKREAIIGAQTAFKAIKALKSNTNQIKEKETVSAFQSLAQTNGESASKEVVGGVLYGTRYAAAFDMKPETDQKFLENLTISSRIENMEEVCKTEIPDLLKQIRDIPLPKEYLDAGQDLQGAAAEDSDLLEMTTMKQCEYLKAIEQLIPILQIFLRLNLDEQTKINQIIPEDRPVELGSVEFAFFMSHPKFTEKLYQLADQRMHLYDVYRTKAVPGILFRPQDVYCNYHIGRDVNLVKRFKDEVKKVVDTPDAL